MQATDSEAAIDTLKYASPSRRGPRTLARLGAKAAVSIACVVGTVVGWNAFGPATSFVLWRVAAANPGTGVNFATHSADHTAFGCTAGALAASSRSRRADGTPSGVNG